MRDCYVYGQCQVISSWAIIVLQHKKMLGLTFIGIFRWFPTLKRCGELPQVLQQDERLPLVDLGASAQPLRCLQQLHCVWSPGLGGMRNMHQWSKRVCNKFSVPLRKVGISASCYFSCPSRECHSPHKCQGDWVDSFRLVKRNISGYKTVW